MTTVFYRNRDNFMNALFEISIINSFDNKVLVLSKGANTMSDYISDIATLLSEKSYRGEVIFDLVLSNGIEDRYYGVNFNGNSFDLITLNRYTNVSFEILRQSKMYYREHIKLLRSSNLSIYQREQFIKFLKE